ncbi:MAG: hypothetical protein NE330_11770 [Lentisphaeraceae bacterium]|nr:hypothetical protein [Lentisphaeraceae bacterium]
MMKRFCLVFFVLFMSLSAQVKDPSKLESEDFLELCQKQLLGNCWLKMSGRMNVRATIGERQPHMSISCAAQLVPNKITFKATLNKAESFKVEHVFGKKHDTKVLENKLGKENGFSKVGIKPSDLSLSFMYWDYIKEYERDSLGVLRVKCRVLLLGNPDGSEFAKVWLSEKHLGPLKVQWFVDLKKGPKQELTFEDFAEKNKVWVPLEVKITNKKGDLQIKFEDIDAQFSAQIPENLYKTEK